MAVSAAKVSTAPEARGMPETSAAPEVSFVPPLEKWTHEAIDALPDDGMRHELLDGVLLVSPSPVTGHQRAVFRIAQHLDAACPPGYEAFVAPFDWRPDETTSLEPDVLVVPQSALTDKNVVGTPVVVVEVLSPGTARIDRTAKMSRYFDGGIAQYWLVDPGDAKKPAAIEVFDRTDDGYQLHASGSGEDEVTIRGIVTVTLRPADLVRPR
jgi:Uma2 family endonuclease